MLQCFQIKDVILPLNDWDGEFSLRSLKIPESSLNVMRANTVSFFRKEVFSDVSCTTFINSCSISGRCKGFHTCKFLHIKKCIVFLRLILCLRIIMFMYIYLFPPGLHSLL